MTPEGFSLVRRVDYDEDKKANARTVQRRVAFSVCLRPEGVRASKRLRDINESLLLIAAARQAWREAVRRGEIREVARDLVEIRW